ncbi:uroporphyrinogen-III synthase [Sodaliphilus sp.]|uniref:uroporphyrinogen-III synthase n=1 Tax=Sodaliphilus sp. TaxID=2815818 RepID=UPI00388D4EFF
MAIRKILISQPRPATTKSPYFDLESKYGIEVVFRPFIKIEGLSAREFRQSRIQIPDYTAIIFTARTAIDHFFRLCKEMRINVPETLKYFCISETIAHYLQKYIVYRKRKIFYSETGQIQGLIPLIEKHNKETYLMPVSDAHDDTKASALDEKGLKYTPAVMYRTVSNDFTPEEKLDYDMLIFFSPAGVKSLVSNFPEFEQGEIAIGAMGQPTIDAVNDAGLRLDITTSPQAPSMAAAIDAFLAKNA